jgi:hypothetical protein
MIRFICHFKISEISVNVTLWIKAVMGTTVSHFGEDAAALH